MRDDDEVVYADAGYQGVDKRPEVTGDEHLSKVEFRVAARKGNLAARAAPDRDAESRKASVRAKVEHPFLIVKRDFGFTKTRYRGLAKNLNHLHVLFASANWLMRARRRPRRVTAPRQPARNGQEPAPKGRKQPPDEPDPAILDTFGVNPAAQRVRTPR